MEGEDRERRDCRGPANPPPVSPFAHARTLRHSHMPFSFSLSWPNVQLARERSSACEYGTRPPHRSTATSHRH